MTYQEMCKASKEELNKEPCRCIRCDDCNGSGLVEYRTNGYPEWDLETWPDMQWIFGRPNEA